MNITSGNMFAGFLIDTGLCFCAMFVTEPYFYRSMEWQAFYRVISYILMRENKEE
jgi:hypothetical protein